MKGDLSGTEYWFCHRHMVSRPFITAPQWITQHITSLTKYAQNLTHAQAKAEFVTNDRYLVLSQTLYSMIYDSMRPGKVEMIS